MKKRKLLALSVCFLCSISLISLLFILSDIYNHSKNGFIRLFPPHTVEPSQNHDLIHNSYYIAGLTAFHIYLGNLTAPDIIISTDYSLSGFDTMRLKFKNKTGTIFNFKLSIDSPNIYLTNGETQTFLHGLFPNLEMEEIYSGKKFSLVAPLSASSFIARIFDSALDQNVLYKQSQRGNHDKKGNSILEKQIDGVFCTDGMLLYDESINKIIYVYYYRNQFIYADTNLKNIQRANTIDTTTTAKIKIYQSLSYTTLASPPLYVNKKSCAWGDLLFVNSALIANNEESRSFHESSVFDMYDIKNGKYRMSFYVTKFGQQPLKDFRVLDKNFVALYGHQILTFKLFY